MTNNYYLYLVLCLFISLQHIISRSILLFIVLFYRFILYLQNPNFYEIDILKEIKYKWERMDPYKWERMHPRRDKVKRPNFITLFLEHFKNAVIIIISLIYYYNY